MSSIYIQSLKLTKLSRWTNNSGKLSYIRFSTGGKQKTRGKGQSVRLKRINKTQIRGQIHSFKSPYRGMPRMQILLCSIMIETIYKYLLKGSMETALSIVKLTNKTFTQLSFIKNKPYSEIYHFQMLNFSCISDFSKALFKLKKVMSLSQFEHYFVQPEAVTLQEIKNLSGKKMDKVVYKNIRNQKYGKQIGHMLQRGDQLRFGLQTFKVVEIEHKFLQLRQKSQIMKQSDANIFQQKYIQQGTCKICLTSDNQSENPLLQPCKCKGSCQYLHLDCLKTWLNSNLVKQTGEKVDSYTWTKFQCEICKVNYPLKLKYKNKIFQLATYEIPKSPYFALQRLRQGPRRKVLIVKAFFEPISIGRNPENDISLTTNSVSRKHACIEYKSGNFFLRDLQSKFGTLVKVRNNLRIDGKMKLQVGDVLLHFDLVSKKYGNEYAWKHN